jgi:hypothetical protein
MTDDRARRAAVLAAAAKNKSQAKTSAAEQAIRTLVKRGEPVTFQGVSREANVSHAFLYANPDLRGRIEHLRAKARPATTPAAAQDTTDAVVLALTTTIDQLKRQHRQDTQALRTALEQAHGENLELRRELARRDHNPPASDTPDPSEGTARRQEQASAIEAPARHPALDASSQSPGDEPAAQRPRVAGEVGTQHTGGDTSMKRSKSRRSYRSARATALDSPQAPAGKGVKP